MEDQMQDGCLEYMVSAGDARPETPQERWHLFLSGRDRINNNQSVIMNWLLGEVLTLTEVALPPGAQLQALKQQIKAGFGRRRAELERDTYDKLECIAGDLGLCDHLSDDLPAGIVGVI
jgi:hypothetical protein